VASSVQGRPSWFQEYTAWELTRFVLKEDIIQGMYCIRKIYANYGRQPLFNRTANDDTSLLKIKKIE
jgi:hypothetical protein